MQSWLEGRIWVGKGAQATGMTASLRILSSKADSNTSKWLPSHFWTRDNVRSILPGLWRKRTGLLLSGPKSSFQMKVHFAFHLEIKVWRHRIMLLEVQCEVSTVSDDLGCHVICWCWSTVFSEVHSQRSHLPGNFRALHASFCWQALWRCWFHFPAGLGTCPHCQRYQKLVQWPWCYCAWLAANSPDLNPIENLWGIVKRTMRDTRPNNADDWRPLSKKPGLPYHLSSATNWSPPCHAELRQ